VDTYPVPERLLLSTFKLKSSDGDLFIMSPISCRSFIFIVAFVM